MMKQLTALAILAVIPYISLADERPYAFTYRASRLCRG